MKILIKNTDSNYEVKVIDDEKTDAMKYFKEIAGTNLKVKYDSEVLRSTGILSVFGDDTSSDCPEIFVNAMDENFAGLSDNQIAILGKFFHLDKLA